MKKKSVAIYMRTSSFVQRERHTIEQQRQIIDKYCADHGINPVEYYIDDGVSSTKLPFDKRPEGQRLIADALAGKFTMLLICDWDRLGRRLEDYVGTLYLLEKDLHIEVVSITQPYEASPEGDMHRDMLGVIAAYEGKRIRARTMRGSRTEAHKPSRFLGGRRTFGFEIQGSKQTARYKLHETEAPIARQIFERIASGQTGSTVGRWLETFQVKTTVGGTIWRASRIQTMIHNPVYKGILVHGRHTEEPITRAVPRIVPDALWEAAQKAMRKNRTLSRRNSKFPYLLRGMLKCRHCGRTYIGTKGFEPSYRCLGRAHAVPLFGSEAASKRCTAPNLNLVAAEDYVWAAAESILKHPGKALEEVRANQERSCVADPKAKAHLQSQLERKQQAKVKLAMREAEGLVDKDTLKAGLQDFDGEIGSLRAQLAELEAQQANAAAQREKLESASVLLKRLHKNLQLPLTFATRRKLLEMMVDHIDVENVRDAKGHCSVKLHAHFRFIDNSSPTARRWTGGC